MKNKNRPFFYEEKRTSFGKILLSAAIILIIVMSIIIVCFKKETVVKDEEKIQIVATLFPQYDFVKQVGGDKVDVKLLLPPGAESHTYEPTPQDMVLINNSDLFIFTGSEMEPWAENLISGMKKDINVLSITLYIIITS